MIRRQWATSTIKSSIKKPFEALQRLFAAHFRTLQPQGWFDHASGGSVARQARYLMNLKLVHELLPMLFHGFNAEG